MMSLRHWLRGNTLQATYNATYADDVWHLLGNVIKLGVRDLSADWQRNFIRQISLGLRNGTHPVSTAFGIATNHYCCLMGGDEEHRAQAGHLSFPLTFALKNEMTSGALPRDEGGFYLNLMGNTYREAVLRAAVD